MEKLCLSLLGNPQITWKNQPYPIPRRTSRALLFFLASHTEPVSRSEILITFWSEASEQNARAQLRDHLGKLRASLPDANMLQANTHQVWLNHDLVQVDVVDFLNTVNGLGRIPWQTPDTQPLSEDLYQVLAAAVRLWRSTSFLGGISLPNSAALEEWISETEQNLLMTRENLIQRLIAHCETTHDPIGAIEWIPAAISSDPYNEDLHLKMIKSLAESGNAAEALKYGRNIVQQFERELSEKPSSELIAVLDDLKKNNIRKDTKSGSAKSAVDNSTIEFVGRYEEIQALTEAENLGRVSLIRGEMGIGKTRLAQEFFKRASRTNRLMLAPCYSSTHGIPLQPILAMSRIDLESQELARLREEDRHQLLALDVALNPISPQQTLKTVPADSLLSVQELFLRYFQTLTEKKKILLLLDDYQWVDQTTIQLLLKLIRHKLIPQRITLVITCDLSRPHQGHGEFIRFLAEKDMLTTISPRTFSKAEEKELAGIVLGKPIADHLLETLHAETNGNPLLIIETVRGSFPNQSTARRVNGNPSIPSNVHALLREKYTQLAPNLTQILSIVAVYDAPIALELIENVSQLPPEEIVDAVEVLEQTKILKPAEEASSRIISYCFTQNIFKEVVLLEISAARKRFLHRRIARALELTPNQPDDTLAAILAYHYTSSGDMLSAFNSWVKAGRFARRLSSPEDAIHAYQEAELLLPLIEMQLDNRAIQRFYDNWAVIAYETQNIPALKQLAAAIGRMGERRSSALLLGTGLLFQAMEKFSTHEYPEGLIIVDQALRYLRETGDLAVILHALDRKSKFLYMLTQFPEAKSILEEGFAILPEELDNELLVISARLYHDYANLLILMGFPAEGMEYSEKAHRAYIQANHLEGQAKVFAQMVISSVYTSQNIKAEQEAEFGLTLAQRSGHLRVAALMRTYNAVAKACRGKMDQAWELTNEAMTAGRSFPFPEIEAFCYQTRGDICRYLHDYQEAATLYAKALDIQAGDFVKCDLLSRLGLVVGLQGNLMQGSAHLSAAHKMSIDLNIGGYTLTSRVHQFIIDPSLQNLAAGKSELEDLRHEATTRQLFSYASILQLLQSRLAYLRGDAQAGTDLFNLALSAPIQVEGIWPGLIHLILQTIPQDDVPAAVRHMWKEKAIFYMDIIAPGCKSVPMKKKWQMLRQTIDKQV